MTDITLNLRLVIDDNNKNEEFISKFTKWLNQEYPKPSYSEYAQEFATKILTSVQVPSEYITLQISHSTKNDYLDELRHPKLDNSGKWLLDDMELKNKSVIFVKLENQWLKAKIETKGKNTSIVFNPENITIPISENLYLHW